MAWNTRVDFQNRTYLNCIDVKIGLFLEVGRSRWQTPHPERYQSAADTGDPGHRPRQKPCSHDRTRGHHGPGQLLGAQWHRVLAAPVAHHRAKGRMRQQPLFIARAALGEAIGCQQHKRCGGQQRQQQPNQTRQQANPATNQPQTALPAAALGRIACVVRRDLRHRAKGVGQWSASYGVAMSQLNVEVLCSPMGTTHD